MAVKDKKIIAAAAVGTGVIVVCILAFTMGASSEYVATPFYPTVATVAANDDVDPGDRAVRGSKDATADRLTGTHNSNEVKDDSGDREPEPKKKKRKSRRRGRRKTRAPQEVDSSVSMQQTSRPTRFNRQRKP